MKEKLSDPLIKLSCANDMKYKTEKELIELLRKLLKALQNGKTDDTAAVITDGNHTKKYSSSDYKRKGYGHHHYKRKHKKFTGSS